jgi:hypothetical protein
VQRLPHLRTNFGAKTFSTGSYHEPVLKSPNEPVLKVSGALGSATDTNDTLPVLKAWTEALGSATGTNDTLPRIVQKPHPCPR